MARFTISGRTTIVGTSALPNVSLYATAAVRPRIVEVGLWNTSSSPVEVALVRLTTAGTQGTGLTETSDDMPEHTAIATGFAGHTVGPTIGSEMKRAVLAAAVGAGVIWTWPDGNPLAITSATTNGIGVIVPTGTGQTLAYSISWIE
jgi:hypothetical protein